MHSGVIKLFIEQFRRCPKCNSQLEIEAKLKNDTSNSHKFRVSTTNDRLIINITSNYFMGSSHDDDQFEFSISIVDGQIMYSDQTNKFISLYDLDMLLFKNCKHCITNSEAFSQTINIFYDRSDSVFVAKPWIEFFSFSYDNSYYYFSNNFRDKRSFLSVQTLNSQSRKPVLETPFIPFEKFEFRNREKLFSKMNSIRLLT